MKLATGAGKLRCERGIALIKFALLIGLVSVVGIHAISHFERHAGTPVHIRIIQTLPSVGTHNYAALPMGNAHGKDPVAICPRQGDLTQTILNSISAAPLAAVEGYGGYGGYDHVSRRMTTRTCGLPSRSRW